MNKEPDKNVLDIQSFRNLDLNSEIVDAAFIETEKYLSDVLSDRKSFDNKAFTLLTGYMVTATTLMSLIASNAFFDVFNIIISIASLLFFLGGIFMILSMKGFDYPFLGSPPENWLRKNVIDSPKGDIELTRMKAYLTHFRIEDIIKCGQSNTKKLNYLEVGIYLGISAIGVLLISAFFI